MATIETESSEDPCAACGKPRREHRSGYSAYRCTFRDAAGPRIHPATEYSGGMTMATLHQNVRDVRTFSGRIREALSYLPAAIRMYGWRVNRTEAEEDYLRNLLNEIIGSATAIAEELDIEL